MPKKRVYRKRKTKVKFYKHLGLKCQGKKELRFIKECERYKRPIPTKAKRILTPYGYYTPDFEYPDRYIEVKCLGTLRVLYGLIAYKGIGKLSTLQLEKILWVNSNIKPVHIIVYLSNKEYKPNLINFNRENLTIIIKGGKIKKTS
jgi:hypothetical protein